MLRLGVNFQKDIITLSKEVITFQLYLLILSHIFLLPTLFTIYSYKSNNLLFGHTTICIQKVLGPSLWLLKSTYYIPYQMLWFSKVQNLDCKACLSRVHFSVFSKLMYVCALNLPFIIPRYET